MPRKNFSTTIIKKRLEHAGYRCEAVLADGKRCQAQAHAGRYQADHDNPDGLTGEPTFENCRILCTECHKAKTAIDKGNIARAKRQEAKHLGIDKAVGPDKPIRSAPMPTTPKAAARAKRGHRPSLPFYMPPGFVSATERRGR